MPCAVVDAIGAVRFLFNGALAEARVTGFGRPPDFCDSGCVSEALAELVMSRLDADQAGVARGLRAGL